MLSTDSQWCVRFSVVCFFFNDTATTEIYTLSLHDALPISLILDGDKNTVEEYYEYIGRQTNNAAEYMALIGGLKKVKKYNPSVLKIFSDSQLMVQQVKGQWRVKDSNLMLLYNKVTGLLSGIDSWQINAVPRNENKRADALANMGIDTGKK